MFIHNQTLKYAENHIHTNICTNSPPKTVYETQKNETQDIAKTQIFVKHIYPKPIFTKIYPNRVSLLYHIKIARKKPKTNQDKQ